MGIVGPLVSHFSLSILQFLCFSFLLDGTDNHRCRLDACLFHRSRTHRCSVQTFLDRRAILLYERATLQGAICFSSKRACIAHVSFHLLFTSKLRNGRQATSPRESAHGTRRRVQLNRIHLIHFHILQKLVLMSLFSS